MQKLQKMLKNWKKGLRVMEAYQGPLQPYAQGWCDCMKWRIDELKAALKQEQELSGSSENAGVEERVYDHSDPWAGMELKWDEDA